MSNPGCNDLRRGTAFSKALREVQRKLSLSPQPREAALLLHLEETGGLSFPPMNAGQIQQSRPQLLLPEQPTPLLYPPRSWGLSVLPPTCVRILLLLLVFPDGLLNLSPGDFARCCLFR